VADPTRPPRGRVGTALLVASAPLLVPVGLYVAWDGRGAAEPGDHLAPTQPVVRVEQPSAAPPSTPPAAVRERGLRPDVLAVPTLGVQAAVRPIMTVDAALTPPSDPRQVGWWSGGARPGSSRGAAVLTGHTVHTGGGAFDDLEQLAEGDAVLVRAGRHQVAYTVSSVEVLSRAELGRRSARIFDRGGAARLVLITCEDWDGTAYRSNVVVTARPS
jgi:LPXTG-site transpeptidase (sortase) family protein